MSAIAPVWMFFLSRNYRTLSYTVPKSRYRTRTQTGGGTFDPTNRHSTLTHTLPLVCKQFHKLVSVHDVYWKHALLRLMQKDPSLWEEGLKHVLFDFQCDHINMEIESRKREDRSSASSARRRAKRTKNGLLPNQESNTATATSFCSTPGHDSFLLSPYTTNEELIDQMYKILESDRRTPPESIQRGLYKGIYQQVFSRHLRFHERVFYMDSEMQIGEPYGLHLFEPRYRILISEVMSRFPLNARRGGRIHPILPGLSPPPARGRIMDDDLKAITLHLLKDNELTIENFRMPTFIHAHQSPLRRNTPATIVQVQMCDISADGSADVVLKPLAYIWIDKVVERPFSGGLYEAVGIRMGAEATAAYERWSGMRAYGRGDGRGREHMLPIP